MKGGVTMRETLCINPTIGKTLRAGDTFYYSVFGTFMSGEGRITRKGHIHLRYDDDDTNKHFTEKMPLRKFKRTFSYQGVSPDVLIWTD